MRLLEGRFSGFGLLDPPPQGRGQGPRTVKFFLFILTGWRAGEWLCLALLIDGMTGFWPQKSTTHQDCGM